MVRLVILSLLCCGALCAFEAPRPTLTGAFVCDCQWGSKRKSSHMYFCETANSPAPPETEHLHCVNEKDCKDSFLVGLSPDCSRPTCQYYADVTCGEHETPVPRGTEPDMFTKRGPHRANIIAAYDATTQSHLRHMWAKLRLNDAQSKVDARKEKAASEATRKAQARLLKKDRKTCRNELLENNPVEYIVLSMSSDYSYQGHARKLDLEQCAKDLHNVVSPLILHGDDARLPVPSECHQPDDAVTLAFRSAEVPDANVIPVPFMPKVKATVIPSVGVVDRTIGYIVLEVLGGNGRGVMSALGYQFQSEMFQRQRGGLLWTNSAAIAAEGNMPQITELKNGAECDREMENEIRRIAERQKLRAQLDGDTNDSDSFFPSLPGMTETPRVSEECDALFQFRERREQKVAKYQGALTSALVQQLVPAV